MANLEAYQQKAEAKLEEVSARLDLLRAQAKDKSADARIALDRQISELEKQRETLAERLGELRDAGADIAEDLGQAINEAVENAGKALENALD
ncbi:MAG: hypothetical protein KIS85_08375 [Anaerolineales bacterium]|nr:hypothetical protein [Anaerolineales bacterium]